MYTNPFNRKHSTIRQMIDRFLHPDQSDKRGQVRSLKRVGSSSSNSSIGSNCSSSSASSGSGSYSNYKRYSNSSSVVGFGK